MQDRHAAQAFGQDQARFAGKLFAAVDNYKDDPPLEILLLEKAYDFGIMDPAGYDTAAAALHRLGELNPSLATPSRSTELCRLQYKHGTGESRGSAGRALLEALVVEGQAELRAVELTEASKTLNEALPIAVSMRSPRTDEIKCRVRSVRARIPVKQKLDKLLKRLDQNPDPAIAAEAARVEVFSLDVPGRVPQLPGLEAGSETARMAELAAADPLSLSEEDCRAVAVWYASQVGGADENSRLIIMERSRTLYGRFIAMHVNQDDERAKASDEMTRISKQLDQAGLRNSATETAKQSSPDQP